MQIVIGYIYVDFQRNSVDEPRAIIKKEENFLNTAA